MLWSPHGRADPVAERGNGMLWSPHGRAEPLAERGNDMLRSSHGRAESVKQRTNGMPWPSHGRAEWRAEGMSHQTRPIVRVVRVLEDMMSELNRCLEENFENANPAQIPTSDILRTFHWY